MAIYFPWSFLKEKKFLELNPRGKNSLAQIIATNIQWRSYALHVKN